MFQMNSFIYSGSNFLATTMNIDVKTALKPRQQNILYLIKITS